MDHPEDVNVSVTYLEKNLVGRPATTDTEKQLSDLDAKIDGFIRKWASLGHH
jgi:hypothetical protein